MRHGRGGHGFPASRLIRSDLGAALPGCSAGPLAAGMAQLDGNRHGRMRSDRRQHPGQGSRIGIGVEAEVLGRDPSLRRDRSCLKDHEARPRQGEVAEMDHVPVRRLAVLGRVLAHGRDDDPVREAKIANQQRLEQTNSLPDSRDRQAAGTACFRSLVQCGLWEIRFAPYCHQSYKMRPIVLTHPAMPTRPSLPRGLPIGSVGLTLPFNRNPVERSPKVQHVELLSAPVSAPLETRAGSV